MGGLFHKLRHPRRCYVVCTIPRSGSNLLTDGLRATRQAGVPKQFFLPKSEGRYGAELGLDPNADYSGYVRAIVNTKTTRNEVFGFKLMSWYLDDFLAQLRDARAFGDAATNARERAVERPYRQPGLNAQPIESPRLDPRTSQGVPY